MKTIAPGPLSATQCPCAVSVNWPQTTE